MSMTKIEHAEVTTATQASIEFTSIPATYTDLLIVFSGRSTKSSTTDNVALTFNSSSANYSSRLLYQENAGTPASATGGSSNITFLYVSGATATSNTFGSAQIYIPLYSGSNAKSLSIDTITENNSSSTIMGIAAGLWNDSTAISSIKLDPVSGDFAQYSSATLYGITAGSDGTTTVS